MRLRGALMGFLAGWLAASSASAREADPAALAAQLMLAREPACTLCHVAADAGTNDAGVGDASTPFARDLLARGFRDDDASSLSAALAAMKRDDADGDGDGATDLDELSWGGDPNVADVPVSTAAEREGPQTGCAVGARGGVEWGPAFLLSLVLARRRRSRKALPASAVLAVVRAGPPPTCSGAQTSMVGAMGPPERVRRLPGAAARSGPTLARGLAALGLILGVTSWRVAAEAQPSPTPPPAFSAPVAVASAPPEARPPVDASAAAPPPAAPTIPLTDAPGSPESTRADSPSNPEVQATALPSVAGGPVHGYAKRGVWEMGGSVSYVTGATATQASIAPTVGYFFVDYVQLSVVPDLEYAKTTDAAGRIRLVLLLEPSWHMQLHQGLFLFFGAGVGTAYEKADGLGLAIAPRTGLNLLIGGNGILSVSFEYVSSSAPKAPAGQQLRNTEGLRAGYTVAW